MNAFAGVVGQPELVGSLRAAAQAPVHAYLLVGPRGAGAQAAARAFSAALLCPGGGCGHCRDCRLALAGTHPDAISFEPEGAFLLKPDAEAIIQAASRSPVEGDRKVLVLNEFHRVQHVGPMLLKTIEEPPISTVFVILADHIPPELVTVASRCAVIDVAPLSVEAIESALVSEGVDPASAGTAALSAIGDLDRARLLVTDPELAARRSAWAGVPDRLDGTGASAAQVVRELSEMVRSAAAPLEARQVEDVAQAAEVAKATGERATTRKARDDTHRRELRRHRSEELRFGLGVLAGRYRDAMVTAATADDGNDASLRPIATSLEAITEAAAALVRNPNETLLLQALMLRLTPLRS